MHQGGCFNIQVCFQNIISYYDYVTRNTYIADIRTLDQGVLKEQVHNMQVLKLINWKLTDTDAVI